MLRSALIITSFLILSGCSYKTDIPTEFPTPQPPPSATPLPKLELKRDAELEKQFAEIAKDAKGKVGVAAVVLETGDAALLNPDDHYPMQSVYKLPISMAVMDQVRQGNHALDEQIGVTSDDFVRQGQASPLRDKNPKGGVFTIRELIRLALVESDGSASDVLLRVLGGPDKVQSYLSEIGIEDMKVVNTEKELGADWNVQYQNWATPVAAVDVIRYYEKTSREAGDTADEEDKVLDEFLRNVVTGPNRIKGLLPKGTVVVHKTGTGGTRQVEDKSRALPLNRMYMIALHSVTSATNDSGVIDLPNGKHLAIAVFVSDSPEDEKTREAVIARIAKAAWDKWAK